MRNSLIVSDVKGTLLQPLLPFKIDQHRYPDESHAAKGGIVTETPVEFWHELEIHAVHP